MAKILAPNHLLYFVMHTFTFHTLCYHFITLINGGAVTKPTIAHQLTVYLLTVLLAVSSSSKGEFFYYHFCSGFVGVIISFTFYCLFLAFVYFLLILM